jgi:hypothetical protein
MNSYSLEIISWICIKATCIVVVRIRYEQVLLDSNSQLSRLISYHVVLIVQRNVVCTLCRVGSQAQTPLYTLLTKYSCFLYNSFIRSYTDLESTYIIVA